MNNVLHLGDLGNVRDMLSQWEAIRQEMLAGNIAGYATVLRSAENRETFYVGGSFRASPADTLKASLRLSAVRMRAEDPPLKKCAS